MPLNMQQLVKSRKKPGVGDIFVFKMLPDQLYRYGRVIRADLDMIAADGRPGSMKAVLVYIYAASAHKKLPIPPLHKDELLLPPVLTNDTGWRDGYFETLERRPIERDDVFTNHCFYDGSHKRVVDLNRKAAPEYYKPYGLYAVGGYGAIDWDVSKALGFPEPTEDAPQSADDPKRKRKLDDAGHTVTLGLAEALGGPLGFADMEDRLADAVRAEGVGEWEGHELAVDGMHALIYFVGKDADRLADVILMRAREAGVPSGSYLIKRYGVPDGREERVNI